MKPFLVLIGGLLLFGACKKDTQQQSTISFNLNGTAKSYTVYTNAFNTYDSLGVQQKSLILASPGVVSGPALSSGILLAVEQTVSLPGSNVLSTGIYPDAALFDSACIASAGYVAGCNGFYFTYYDATYPGGLNNNKTDSSGEVTITAFSTSPNTVSGNFSCRLSDQFGNYYAVTNGQFSNVPYVVQ